MTKKLIPFQLDNNLDKLHIHVIMYVHNTLNDTSEIILRDNITNITKMTSNNYLKNYIMDKNFVREQKMR